MDYAYLRKLTISNFSFSSVDLSMLLSNKSREKDKRHPKQHEKKSSSQGYECHTKISTTSDK